MFASNPTSQTKQIIQTHSDPNSLYIRKTLMCWMRKSTCYLKTTTKFRGPWWQRDRGAQWKWGQPFSRNQLSWAAHLCVRQIVPWHLDKKNIFGKWVCVLQSLLGPVFIPVCWTWCVDSINQKKLPLKSPMLSSDSHSKTRKLRPELGQCGYIR